MNPLHPVTGPTWTLGEIPDLSGRRAVVTGVTGGLGEHTALELARKGAEVVLSARDEVRLAETAERIRRAVPTARLVPLVMDLADLASVRRAAARQVSRGPVHLLVNNAGVMATPQRRTVDGFDLQMATNHFGHFAFTGLLLPALAAEGARVVSVSSQAHRLARGVPLTDPRQQTGRYWPWLAYAESKLANLLFAFELHRRATRDGYPLVSVAAHPGYASTNLTSTRARFGGGNRLGAAIHAATGVLGQSAPQGALPLLMAATLPGLAGGCYVGPRGPGEMRGQPTLVGTTRVARDEELARRFWELSQRATGVSYP